MAIVNFTLPGNCLKPTPIITVLWNRKSKAAMKTIVAGFFIFIMMMPTGTVRAQSVEQMQKIFPDKLAVFSNINRSVEISFKKGIPYAEANEVSEMMILNDN